MPSGIPLVMKTTTPAMMMTHDKAMACQRQRRKSTCVSLKICITFTSCPASARLNAQRGDLLPLAQRQLEERLRDKNRGEQVRQQTEEEGHGEAADRAGAELEQERHRDQRGDVGIEQRPENAGEAGVDRGADAARGLDLFLDALEDQHV